MAHTHLSFNLEIMSPHDGLGVMLTCCMISLFISGISGDFTLTILHTNDVHARFEQFNEVSDNHILPKFWRYNKASLGELVSLEILGKHQQGFTHGVCLRYYPVFIHSLPYIKQFRKFRPGDLFFVSTVEKSSNSGIWKSCNIFIFVISKNVDWFFARIWGENFYIYLMYI